MISEAADTQPRRSVILATCCLSLLMISMDSTIVNVALPAIRQDFQASLNGLQWVIDAYTVVLASFLMLGGSTADRFGRRRVFLFGMVLFTSASLLCSLATSLHLLIAARVMQALGGSMLNPVAMSIIVHTFSAPKEKARAIGIWGGVAGIAMALGPLAGGALTQSFGWHAIFWINVPIGLLAILLTVRYLPESHATQVRRADPVGQLLLLTTLGALIYTVIEGSKAGGAIAVTTGVLAGAAFAALIAYESRRREPLLDLRFFRSVPFSSATVIAVCMFSALGGLLFLSSLYLQEVRGFSAFRTGLCILPMAVIVMIVSPLSGRLVGARGARPSLLISGIMMTLSALLLTQLSTETPIPVLLMTYCIFGVGFGMVNAPITYTAVSGMPRAQAGLAAAIASTSRQVGTSTGVAVAGALTGSRLLWGTASWAAFPEATHIVWWLLVGCGLMVLTLGFVSTGRWAQASSERIAHLLQEPGAGAST